MTMWFLAAELTHLSTQHAAHASQDCLNRSSKAYAQVSRFRLSDVGCSRPQSKNAKPHNVVCHFPCPPFGPGGFPFSFERRHAQHHHHTVGKLAWVATNATVGHGPKMLCYSGVSKKTVGLGTTSFGLDQFLNNISRSWSDLDCPHALSQMIRSCLNMRTQQLHLMVPFTFTLGIKQVALQASFVPPSCRHMSIHRLLLACLKTVAQVPRCYNTASSTNSQIDNYVSLVSLHGVYTWREGLLAASLITGLLRACINDWWLKVNYLAIKKTGP